MKNCRYRGDLSRNDYPVRGGVKPFSQSRHAPSSKPNAARATRRANWRGSIGACPIMVLTLVGSKEGGVENVEPIILR